MDSEPNIRLQASYAHRAPDHYNELFVYTQIETLQLEHSTAAKEEKTSGEADVTCLSNSLHPSSCQRLTPLPVGGAGNVHRWQLHGPT
jgi:hypothetical protein